ncbi:probable cig2 protein (putative GDP-GTP exchange factor) [Serendipita indica DSM 11827]|uniref:Probable cig2 protein (Putative GDP-GTP exchange factor) n=1 Tax=Serendipita indica (strain DSM 11827) TaxID=1109443 RepID=G4T529_SERID|nr:probable cig2 protein (putative GDP-GTP exchange factor) [Serendipita indica DSM 11827]
MALTSIRTNGDDIEIVDQLLLPHTVAWVAIKSPDDAYTAIKSMMIRGAPAIASLAALSVSSYLSRALEEEPRPAFLTSYQLLEDHLSPILAHLYASRPTAVNLGAAITRLQGVLAAGRAEARKGPTDEQTSLAITVKNLIAEGRAVADEDVGRNKIMGQLGADWILRKAEENHQDITEGLNILTVCNTGSLATSGYGTALGIITRLHEMGKLKRALLTALELKTLSIPSTMICDSMVGSCFQHYPIHASWGQIGLQAMVTLQTRAPSCAIRGCLPSLNPGPLDPRWVRVSEQADVRCQPNPGFSLSIPIEYRPPIEACLARGRVVGGLDPTIAPNAQAVVQITPDLALNDGGVFNPSFDVTPAALISAVVTEKGVAERTAEASIIQVGNIS